MLENREEGVDGYEPKYVSQLARQIMDAAGRIVITRTVVGGLIGGAVGALVTGFSGNGTIGFLVGAALGAGAAHVNAQYQVLMMRAQAQLMLTLLQIEINTQERG